MTARRPPGGLLAEDLSAPIETLFEFIGEAYVQISAEVGRLEHVCDDYEESEQLLRKRYVPGAGLRNGDNVVVDWARSWYLVSLNKRRG
eukprot:1182137-Prorocentrum_minimum.AAC.1